MKWATVQNTEVKEEDVLISEKSTQWLIFAADISANVLIFWLIISAAFQTQPCHLCEICVDKQEL